MDNEVLDMNRPGFIDDDSTGVDREERKRIVHEMGLRILEQPAPRADFSGKDKILLAFVPSTCIARYR